MIGKSIRGGDVAEATKKYKAIYFGSTCGVGALIAKRIKAVEIVEYEDLGPESIRKIEVEDFPAIVVNDVYSNDLYLEGRKRYIKL